MNLKTLPPAIFLMGPTASGKTGAAVALISKLPVELISVDSALVYRDMNIGTAKPDHETLAKAPHHLIDIIAPTEAYSAANFRNDALCLMADITSRGKVPLLVGGTMLYFKALQDGLSHLPEANAQVREEIEQEAAQLGWPAMHAKLAIIDPDSAARLQPNDVQRIERSLEVYRLTGQSITALHLASGGDALPYRLLKIALVPKDRKTLHERIAQRFDQMLAGGFLDEVKALVAMYPILTADSTSMRCVGYRQALAYLAGEYDEAHLRDRGIFATRQLAKRQLTWLRGMDDLDKVDCLDPAMHALVLDKIAQFIKE
ncbi:MAG: tRNA (adenosine(37)-N6)-dimethylallyltransferase MiaA [Methylotenera sp.]|nr:tRNA (adenosine(37)-N6)-dimethylallyltransferase MiaA [Methylotenera sp.]MDO9234069.1 tRNA (adenosine(37)-N6)-dimethylallyltransferase MiaA [Methylotenera sp.]MDO9389495.1 tRNA (adenosine(37)-N6)-dimethylallyltransferase MiaA [Methylotenera sp.]MDP2101690.1 tRNA (adenosine(37)-N6)-dimethylallyltransferase MiaA [Methylotenera sp.]MDP2281519.1 tRNA (adenosine(37)-N6)-dimethylallyltransferase MiaA [Methylotenera sp.]